MGTNGDVNITLSASRKIHIESTIVSGSGQVNRVVWTQDLQYQNVQNFLDDTLIQVKKIKLVLLILWALNLDTNTRIYRMSYKLHLAMYYQHTMEYL